MNTRGLYWIVFLTGAGVLAAIPELFFDELPVPASSMQRTAGSSVDVQGSAIEQSGRAVVRSVSAIATVPATDLFAPHQWRVAPVVSRVAPPVIAVPPPQPPSAPPMPFRFIGKLDDSQDLRVFLLRGEQLYTVRVGDVIERTYRVDDIDRSRMTLTYLPLSISQSLVVGSEP